MCIILLCTLYWSIHVAKFNQNTNNTIPKNDICKLEGIESTWLSVSCVLDAFSIKSEERYIR